MGLSHQECHHQVEVEDEEGHEKLDRYALPTTVACSVEPMPPFGLGELALHGVATLEGLMQFWTAEHHIPGALAEIYPLVGPFVAKKPAHRLQTASKK